MVDGIDLRLGDCLEVMRRMDTNSVDLIVTDPPYFKVKAEWWDRQWEKPAAFLAWLDTVAEQWQRILKPNGSLYCFASPKMSARVEVLLGDRFNVLNHIVWDKAGKPYAEKYNPVNFRAYVDYSERIIFCEHYGADNIAKGEAGYGAKCDELRGFVFEPLRAYLDGELTRSGASLDQMPSILGFKSGDWIVKHYIESSQWRCPTPEHYTKLQQAFPGYFTRPYEDLRKEYEDLRRPFSISADVPYTDVWTFPTVGHYPGKHPCEKPAPLLEHIITASSRPGAVILDCFAGSGSTLVAAQKLGRQPLGIEIDPHWASVCRHRLGDFTKQHPTLEERVKALEFQQRGLAAKVRRIEASGQLSLFG